MSLLSLFPPIFSILPKVSFAFALWFASTSLLAGYATAGTRQREPMELPILQDWRGDYPVSQLNRLPQGQRTSRIGYLSDRGQFADVWPAFKPEESLPVVDFSKHLVVFRNVDFHNRIAIVNAIFRDGAAEILAMQTMSASPIADQAAMALAVIPRAGVNFIEAGNERVPVTVSDDASASDPLHATYTIEGRKIHLHNGRAEVPIGPDTGTTIRTSVFGKPVDGDLDGDGDEDAALLLVHEPGGSGTFYYVAVALNLNGPYHGTNAVLLGDRIVPGDVAIRNGVVVVSYAGRRPNEPMITAPSVGKTMYLILKNGNLTARRPLGEGEQILEGWVTIGHEVRSFTPCSRNVEHWLLGGATAWRDIMARYRDALPDARPYTPLFMILAGKVAETPPDGFGADYAAAFLATQLVGVRPKGNCRSDAIVVDTPAPGAAITSPLTVSGRARGTWFFEGDFPIVLKDIHGNVMAQGFVTAKGDWMTKAFVPFEGTLAFDKPGMGDRGTLLFKKDNPSDRSELDDRMEIIVFFR